MSADALTPITYVWHYVLARLVYDELVRPAIHGNLGAIVVICAVAGGCFLLGWRTGRPRPPRRRRV
jgi:hypothetical protein